MFGAIGLGYFTYGRRQRAVVPLVVGLAFFIFPYFVSNGYVMAGIGIVLMIIPYFVRI